MNDEIDWKSILLDKLSDEYDEVLYQEILKEKTKQKEVTREFLIEMYYRCCMFEIAPIYDIYKYTYNEKEDLLIIDGVIQDEFKNKIVVCIPYAFDVINIEMNYSRNETKHQVIDLGNIKSMESCDILHFVYYLKYFIANNLTFLDVKEHVFYTKRLIRVYINKVTYISDNLFMNSDKLKYVEVKSLKIIDKFLFSMCTNLELIELGKNVEYISSVAFSYEYKAMIVYEGSLEEWNTIEKPVNYYTGLGADSLPIIFLCE